MSYLHERIAESLRCRIRDGELPEGGRLPNVKSLAAEYQTSTATVGQALRWLQVEGYIRTTQRGTWVEQTPPVGSTPQDRLIRTARTGSLLGAGETQRIMSAQLVLPPLYVAELYDLDPGDQVLRREAVTGKGPERVSLSVDWYPAALAAQVPDLLSMQPSKAQHVLKSIKGTTGRAPKYGRDSMHAREADDREANYLAIKIHTPILAIVHEWSDDQGLIVYGEECYPPRRTIGYDYRL